LQGGEVRRSPAQITASPSLTVRVAVVPLQPQRCLGTQRSDRHRAGTGPGTPSRPSTRCMCGTARAVPRGLIQAPARKGPTPGQGLHGASECDVLRQGQNPRRPATAAAAMASRRPRRSHSRRPHNALRRAGSTRTEQPTTHHPLLPLRAAQPAEAGVCSAGRRVRSLDVPLPPPVHVVGQACNVLLARRRQRRSAVPSVTQISVPLQRCRGRRTSTTVSHGTINVMVRH
jgi:hypothetical protein